MKGRVTKVYFQDRSSEEKEPVVKKSKSQDILENPQPSTSRATQDDVYVDENIDSDAPFSDNGQEVITREVKANNNLLVHVIVNVHLTFRISIVNWLRLSLDLAN